MSIAAMAYVWEHSQQKGTELIMLLAIADYANEHGKAWPGIPTLAKRVRVDLRTAQRCLKRVLASGELRINPGGGPKGCHMYQLVMVKNLTLFDDHQGDGESPPGKLPGVANEAKGGGVAVPPEPRSVTTSKTGGQSPTALCAAAYRQGIKDRYQADYPPSAKLNGIMAQLVRELGGDVALAVVKSYVASGEKWYVTKRHALEYLKRDAAQIWIHIQEGSGRRGEPAKVATAILEFGDGRPESRLRDYPVDEPERVARQVLRDFASRIPGWKPRNIVIEVGARRHPFSVAELGR